MDDATRGVGSQKWTSGTAQTEPPRASDTLMSEEDDARAQAIRGEIAETRNEISETIDAIQERLQPGNLVAQAGETVRHAASEKVRQMANTAGDAADQVLGSSFMETVRANPVPAALIGIGAAWMLFNRRSRDYRYDEAYRGYGTSGRRNPYVETLDRESAGSYGAVGTRGTIGSQGIEEVRSRAKEYASDVTARAQEFTGEVRETARRTSQRAQVKFEDVLRNNPLALGAAAALVGAVVGMSVPPTATENQLMGEARDSVVDRARNLASDAAEQVSHAAGSAQSLASRAADQIKKSASGAHDITGPLTDQQTPFDG
jgi:ElaB/YqjD/DUF883 family membrane-anchored ribosome-binding protein